MTARAARRLLAAALLVVACKPLSLEEPAASSARLQAVFDEPAEGRSLEVVQFTLAPGQLRIRPGHGGPPVEFSVTLQLVHLVDRSGQATSSKPAMRAVFTRQPTSTAPRSNAPSHAQVQVAPLTLNAQQIFDVMFTPEAQANGKVFARRRGADAVLLRRTAYGYTFDVSSVARLRPAIVDGPEAFNPETDVVLVDAPAPESLDPQGDVPLPELLCGKGSEFWGSQPGEVVFLTPDVERPDVPGSGITKQSDAAEPPPPDRAPSQPPLRRSSVARVIAVRGNVIQARVPSWFVRPQALNNVLGDLMTNEPTLSNPTLRKELRELVERGRTLQRAWDQAVRDADVDAMARTRDPLARFVRGLEGQLKQISPKLSEHLGRMTPGRGGPKP